MFRSSKPLFLQIQKIKKTPERVMQVYDWASFLTAEEKPKGWLRHFYWTKAAKKLLFKTKHLKSGLIGLKGLQGTGKTSILYAVGATLYTEKVPAAFYTWTSKYKGSKIYEQLFETSYEEESYFPPGKERYYIFLDLQDYTRTNSRLMNKHLDEIQQLWTLCHQNGRPVVFVISFQKELFRGHFLMGKMHTIEVTPLKPKELLKAYKLRFGSPEPFTEEALLLITELSRGVFRRFLKYIGLCLERVIESEIKIDIVDIRLVKETITLDQLSEDMDLELSGIFRRDDKKMQAVRALNLLREKGESNQKELAEKLNMHPNTLSRLLDKLEANNYVKRRRGLKKELLVSLK